ncbi:MAG TPA: alpha/beta hydrolase [Terriglobales bacterium]|nr:alpha/beta hydrolase [Terriglobales bacterium]
MSIARSPMLLLCALVCSLSLFAATTKDGTFQTSDGIRLHYLEAGTGAAVVFVPGWTMPAKIWEPQLQELSRKYQVIALDPRSQGDSEKTPEGNFSERRAADVKELIEHLHASPAVLVGWSLGVREALVYVRVFGTSSLRGLVLVDGNVWTEPAAQGYEQRAAFLHGVQENRAEFTEKFVRSMYHKPQSPAYLKEIVTQSLKTPTNTAVALLAEMYLWNDLRPILSTIRIPLLVTVRADHRDQAEIVRSLVPQAQSEVFEDAGHALFVDDAERFNAVMERFLALLPR